MFVPIKPFKFSLMFARKTVAYPSDAPKTSSTLGYAIDLTHRH